MFAIGACRPLYSHDGLPEQESPLSLEADVILDGHREFMLEAITQPPDGALT
jgi:hypothetical protein